MVYAFFIVFAIICSVLFDGQEGYGGLKGHAWRAMCVALIAIAGFRWGVGGDTFIYMHNFQHWYEDAGFDLGTFTWEFKHSGYMPLWVLVNIVPRAFTDSWVVFQLINATIVNIAICWFVRRHTKYGFLFLLFYFVTATYFLFNTEILREGLAIAMGLVAIECYTSGRKGLYGLFVVLALGFHISAAILLLLPVVPHIPMNFKTLIRTSLLAFVIWATSDILLNLIAQYATFLPNSLSVRLLGYSALSTNIFGFARYLLHYLLVPGAAICFALQHETSAEEKTFREKMASYYLILALVAVSLAGFTRFANYAMIFELIMLAEVTGKLLNEKQYLIARAGTVVSFVALYAWVQLTHYPQNNFYMYEFYAPYMSVWHYEEDEVNRREEAHLESCRNDWGDEGVRDMDY